MCHDLGATKRSHSLGPTKKGVFEVKAFYNMSLVPDSSYFPRMIIWQNKAPLRAKCFEAIVLGTILTLNDVSKRQVVVIDDWRCICKWMGETIDQLLSHCREASTIYKTIFGLFGIDLVMSTRVVDTLACWKEQFSSQCTLLWKMIVLFNVVCLWGEKCMWV